MGKILLISVAFALVSFLLFSFSFKKKSSKIHVPDSFYTIKLKDIDKKNLDLTDLKNKPILIVNVASRCGFTSQYSDLETLHNTYKDKGLVLIGVPTNDFGGQEPGTEESIKTFCQTKYNVSFMMTEKLKSKGTEQHPLFTFLTQSNIELKGPVSWNFNKFLISPEGKLVARFGSSTKPLSQKIISSIESQF
jgi:glutathione peroxidase